MAKQSIEIYTSSYCYCEQYTYFNIRLGQTRIIQPCYAYETWTSTESCVGVVENWLFYKLPDRNDSYLKFFPVRSSYCLCRSPSEVDQFYPRMSRSDLPFHARGYDANSESASSPTEHEALSPTKADRPAEFSKKHDVDPSKKHVSVSVPGVVKPKAPVKKKKVAPTLVSILIYFPKKTVHRKSIITD